MADLDARPLVEIGWVLAGDFDVDVLEAVDRARGEALADLERLAAFRFEIRIRRRAAPREHAVEPIALIDIGAIELDAGRWDFAVVLTAAELRAHQKPFALGAPASSLNVAVLSTARLTPQDTAGPETDSTARRIASLFLHLFGHLNDLEHASDPSDFMRDPDAEVDLDVMDHFSDEHVRRLNAELGREADERIEERVASVGALRFYVEATWDNRSDIYHAVVKIQPWLFFTSFSRLTTTAVSAMIVILITAEAWDMAARQSPTHVLLAGGLSVVLTTGYVLRRQRLLERLRNRGLTEQKAIANVTVTLAVLVGMTTTYALLFGLALAFTELLQPRALIGDWLPKDLWPVRPAHYLTMCNFAATLGVLLGALGASFESETYFRHVVLVDEET